MWNILIVRQIKRHTSTHPNHRRIWFTHKISLNKLRNSLTVFCATARAFVGVFASLCNWLHTHTHKWRLNHKHALHTYTTHFCIWIHDSRGRHPQWVSISAARRALRRKCSDDFCININISEYIYAVFSCVRACVICVCVCNMCVCVLCAYVKYANGRMGLRWCDALVRIARVLSINMLINRFRFESVVRANTFEWLIHTNTPHAHTHTRVACINAQATTLYSSLWLFAQNRIDSPHRALTHIVHGQCVRSCLN